MRLGRGGFMALVVGGLLGCGSDFTNAPFGSSASSVGGAGGETSIVASSGSNGETAGTGGTVETAGTGGTVETAGAGGSPCDSNDADKDGVSGCQGDCDDANAAVKPGAPEICGDGVANGCNGAGDPASCMGLGTFVSAAIGNDANPGTQAKPLKTIQAGMTNAAKLSKQPVFVAAGTYQPTNSPGGVDQAKFVLVEGVSLLGGYRCDGMACTWARDLKNNISRLEAVDRFGIHAPAAITNATLVEGFTIVGWSGDAGEQFGVAVSILGAPTIRKNVVLGGDSTNLNGRTVGIRVYGPPSSKDTAQLVQNTIVAGKAAAISIGVGIQLSGARANVVGNDVRGGQSGWSRAVAIGFDAGEVNLARNDITAGPCDYEGTSYGVYADDSVGPRIDSNRINTDEALVGGGAKCATWAYSGGIESRGSSATITNNVVLGVAGSSRSVGILLGDGDDSTGTPIVNGNTIDGGGKSAAQSAAMVIRAAKKSVTLGKIRNNILLGGKASQRFAFVESFEPGLEVKPAAFTHNVLWGTFPALYSDGAFGYTTISALEQNVDGAQNNLSVDPALDATYHLIGNACVDKGTSAEAPQKDIDGDDRPKGNGFDIGADEKG